MAPRTRAAGGSRARGRADGSMNTRRRVREARAAAPLACVEIGLPVRQGYRLIPEMQIAAPVGFAE